MPRLREIGLGALEDLAGQLRYAPKGAVARHVRAIGELALGVRTEDVYSEEWIVRRITGYAQEIDEPAMILGGALRGELSALAERISAAAKMRDADLGEVLGIDAVCARWSVSRKTIERWRKRGLVGVRTMGEGGHARVVFLRTVVEGFEEKKRGLVARGRSFARIDDKERTEMERAARENGGVSRSAAVAAAAAAVGRSRETARRALREVGEEEGGWGGVVRARGVLGAHERREAADLYTAGAPAAAVAARFGKSAASVRRVSAEVRAERLRALRLPEWEADDAAIGIGLVSSGLLVDAPGDLHGIAAMVRGDGPVDAEEERALARGYRALVARAGETVRGLARFGSSVRGVDAAELDLRWAAMVKRRVVRGEMGLIVRTIEERAGEKIEKMDREEGARVFALAVRSVCDAVDAYDPSHGGRLAAPAGVLMARALAKGDRAAGFARGGLDWRGGVAAWCGMTDMPGAVRDGLEKMDEGVRGALVRQYGLDGGAPVLLREACKEAGVTMKRVRGAVWRVVSGAAS